MPRIARAITASGLALVVGAAAGCSSSHSAPPAPFAASAALPVLTAPAAAGSQTDLGIAEWRIYVGLNREVLAGFDSSGNAMGGVDLSAEARAGSSLAYVRITLLDGTDTAVFHLADGEDQGTVSSAQSLFLAHAIVDTWVYATQTPISTATGGACQQSAEVNAVSIGAGGIDCTLGQTGAFQQAIASVLQEGDLGSVAGSIPGCAAMVEGMASLVAGCNATGDAGCVENPATGTCEPGVTVGGSDGAAAAVDAGVSTGDAAAGDAASGDGGPIVVAFDGGAFATTTSGQTDGIDDMANNRSCPSCPAGAQQLVMSGQTGYVEATIAGDYGYAGVGFVVVDGSQDFSQDSFPAEDVSQDGASSQDSTGSQDSQDTPQDPEDPSEDFSSRRHTRSRPTAWSRFVGFFAR